VERIAFERSIEEFEFSWVNRIEYLIYEKIIESLHHMVIFKVLALLLKFQFKHHNL